MYDISQLNDLLVPELLDIAEELKIPNSKKLNKTDLVQKIMDKQVVMTAENKTPEGEKPKRKRIAKVVETEPAHEVAEVKQAEAHKKDASPAKPKRETIERKAPVKKPKAEEQPDDDEEELQPITNEQSSIPAAIAQMLQQEDIQQPEVEMDDEPSQQSNNNNQPMK